MTTRVDILKNEYNPYEHRDRPNLMGTGHALMNLLKGLLGTGLTAMPLAFKNIGIINGTIILILIAVMMVYCLQLLFKAMYFVCKRKKIPQTNYSTTLREAFTVGPVILRKFSNCAPIVINIFIIMYQSGVCCVYVMFTAMNTKVVIDSNTEKENHVSLTLYMILYIIPCLFLTYIEDLKSLASVSNLGNILTVVCLLIIYYCTFDNLAPISERKFFGSIEEFPTFMGTALFAILSIGEVISIERNMKDGDKFLGFYGVLNQGMFITVFLNIFTGIMGYWKYGDEIGPTITVNLGVRWYARTVQFLLAIVILLSFPLQAYPNTEILWEEYIEQYMETSQHKMLWNYAVRTILVLTVFLVALPIPVIGLFISIVGSFCLPVLVIIIPPLMDTCFRWNDNDFGKAYSALILNIFLICFGLFGLVYGIYFPVNTIYHKLGL